MKKLILLLTATSWLFAACVPVCFQQIATLSSDNVELKNDGSFVYEDAMVTIEYNFWAESGKFYFVVTNNTDDNLYLNLAESYYVNNGSAYDYYQARTYVYSKHGSAASTSYAPTSVAGYVNVVFGGSNNSVAIASGNGVSVEYSEQPVVCIPAHSSKTFEEFCVSLSTFRECGFIRDPLKDESSVREYTSSTSPRVIENRLVFKLGDVTLPVTNVFYVSEYENIACNYVTEYVKVENCDGTQRRVKVHKMSANNKFYITYNRNDLWSYEETGNVYLSDRKPSK